MLGLVGFVGVWLLRGDAMVAANLLAQAANDAIASHIFGVVPLFVLTGLVVAEADIAKDAFEVANQLALIGNLDKAYGLKTRQVELLENAIDVSGVLFRSARADYMEVLLTRRDALEAEMERIAAAPDHYLCRCCEYAGRCWADR